MSTSSSIHLGLPVRLDPSQLYSLERHYLPLGKCGGHPAWLNPANIPTPSELACQICTAPMAFLLQVYCPAEPEHAFHRIIYVFVCRKGECSKPNDASSFAVFRCQLPRLNPFLGPSSPLDPFGPSGPLPDPFFDPSTFARLCVVCGCRAPKRCARCGQRWYCSREHQIIDWNTTHKGKCTAPMEDQDQQEEKRPAEESKCSSTEKAEQRNRHGFTFKEFGIELCQEEEGEDDEEEGEEGSDEEDEGGDDDEAEGEEENIREEDRLKIREYEKLAAANGVSTRDLADLSESRSDHCFARFSRALSRHPLQLLRYSRGSIPLPATDQSPPLPPPSSVPPCSLCTAPRQFELQLMPHLVALMELDECTGEPSLDWATLAIFSCSRHCAIPGDGYAREFAHKQDFVRREEKEEENDGKKERRKGK